MSTEIRVPVYILAGGKSSRFGSNKARAIFHNQTLIEHVQQLIQNHASRVTAVADVRDKFADLGIRTISDLTPGLGPLGGLISALDDLGPGEHWLLLCSCDAVVIEPAWLDTLLTQAQTQGRASQAIAFKGEYWQPMPALYAASGVKIVEEQAEGRGLSMQKLLKHLHTHALPLPVDWPDRWQVNRLDELDHFCRGDAGRIDSP